MTAPHRFTPATLAHLLLPPMMWAGNAVLGHLMVDTLPPVAMNAWRWLIVAVLLMPWAWRSLINSTGAIRAHWVYLGIIGVLGVGSYNALQYLALHTSTPLNVTLIGTSVPVWMMLVGALLYGVRPLRRQLASAALSLAGVAVVLSRGHLAALGELRLVPGDLLMLLAVMTWAVYSWLLARPPRTMTEPDGLPAWTWAELLCVQMAVGLLWTGGSAGLEAVLTPDAASHWHLSPALLAVLAYIAIGPSILAYRLWGLGVAEAGPAMAAIFANLTPLFAALLSAALLGQGPQGYHALAFALIVGGIAVASPRRANR